MFFKNFFGISQIWTTSDSNNRIKWVENDIHVTESSARSYPRNEKKNSNILFRKHDHECVAQWFLNSKKASEVWKSWDLSRSIDIIHGGHGKNWIGFTQSVMYDV